MSHTDQAVLQWIEDTTVDLLPQLDQSIPRRRNQLGLGRGQRIFSSYRDRATHVLVRQPHMINHHLLVRIQPLQNSAALPVPKHDVALPIAGREEPPIGGKANGARVAGDRVSSKAFLAVLAEVVARVD